MIKLSKISPLLLLLLYAFCMLHNMLPVRDFTCGTNTNHFHAYHDNNHSHDASHTEHSTNESELDFLWVLFEGHHHQWVCQKQHTDAFIPSTLSKSTQVLSSNAVLHKLNQWSLKSNEYHFDDTFISNRTFFVLKKAFHTLLPLRAPPLFA